MDKDSVEKYPREIIFLCGARDFHAMDWYKSAKKHLKNVGVCVLTDLIAGEGFDKIINKNDKVYKMMIIDNLLFKKQSHKGDIWRNILKMLVLPIQAYNVKKFFKNHPNTFFLAHGMYYMKIASKAKVPYIGTSQGSELLVRPYRSKMYLKFATKAMQDAKVVTVDSIEMRNSAIKLFGVTPEIIQNGIDMNAIRKFKSSHRDSEKCNISLSIRGFTPLYRIKEILKGRQVSKKYRNRSFHFIYPFYDDSYINEVKPLLGKNDSLLGRLTRDNMYAKLSETKVVFSIPISDSSPRSVYESVFLGCVVIIAYHPYYDILPKCMQERIVIADISEDGWYDKAMDKANEILRIPFNPTQDAVDLFDQEKSFDKLYKLISEYSVAEVVSVRE